MKVIGITGGSGSGKTTVLRVLERLGAGTIDCDRVYHELLSGEPAMLRDIQAAFPEAAVDGVFDRKALGAIVFADPQAMKTLEEISHRYVLGSVKEKLEQFEREGRAAAAIDAIALIESGLSRLCCVSVAVCAPARDRVCRIMRREGISEEYARLRIQAQKPREFFEENCDIVLENTFSNAGDFEAHAEKILSKII